MGTGIKIKNHTMGTGIKFKNHTMGTGIKIKNKFKTQMIFINS